MAPASLSAEPALPSEREEQHLPPKSYADAVEEEPSATSTNGINDELEEKDVKKPFGVNGKSTPQMASTLRIVNTGSDSKEKETRPEIPRQESKHEYSATGLDDTPRTSPRHKHRKSASRSSNGTQDKPTNGKAKTNGSKDIVFEKENDMVSVKQFKEEKNLLKQKPKSSKQTAELTSIRWSPWNTPIHRRLQTAVVLFHTICLALCISTFCFLCAIPLFWPMLIPYMIYCLTSNAGSSGTFSHRSEFLRRLPVWNLFANYFPMRLHKSAELPPTRKYIFGYHPHGIISMGAFAAFSTEALGFSKLFPGIKNSLLTLDSNFQIPIYRDYVLAMGLASVSKISMMNILSKGGVNKEGMGRAVTVVVGGARESLDSSPNKIRLVLKRRKGFVKIAIRTGADLVPVLAFGENDLYDTVLPDEHPFIHKTQLFIKKVLGWTIPLFHARGVFNYDVGLMPYRKPVNIVVGRPIRVHQSASPEQAEVDRIHSQYMEELQRIWDSHKDEYAKDRKEELIFVE